MMSRLVPPTDPTVVDASSLFDASEAIAERLGRKVTLDYAKLRECLDAFRKKHSWRPASINAILLSIDPSSEGQQRFQAMLRHSGFEPDVIHYREAFVSLPAGHSPRDVNGKPIVSLAPRVAYIAGLLARHENPHFLVVTHSFELFGPLTDLARRVPQGKVGIAYFGSLIDYRWRLAGLQDGKLQQIHFFDLDPSSESLLGTDLVGRPSQAADSTAGLSRF